MRKWFEKTGGERHPKGYNFCGPKTLFALRNMGEDGNYYEYVMRTAGLEPVGTWPYNKPINPLDACAFDHDRVFSDRSATVDEVRKADEQFVQCVKNIKPSMNVYEMATQQIAMMAIKLKMKGEDAGFLKKGLFSDAAQRHIYETLKLFNSTLVEEDVPDQTSFYGLLLGIFTNMADWLKTAGLGTAASVSTTLLVRVSKRRGEIMRSLPDVVQRFIRRIGNLLTQNVGTGNLNTLLEQAVGMFTDDQIRAVLGQMGIVRGASGLAGAGARTLILRILDDYINWIPDSIRSDEWRARNIISEDEIQELIRDPIDPRGITRTSAALTFAEFDVFRTALQGIESMNRSEKAKNVLKILMALKKANTDYQAEDIYSFIKVSLTDEDIYRKINILARGPTITLQTLRGLLNVRISPQVLNDFADRFRQMYPGESQRQFLGRVGEWTYIDLISQARMLQNFADLFK